MKPVADFANDIKTDHLETFLMHPKEGARLDFHDEDDYPEHLDYHDDTGVYEYEFESNLYNLVNAEVRIRPERWTPGNNMFSDRAGFARGVIEACAAFHQLALNECEDYAQVQGIAAVAGWLGTRLAHLEIQSGERTGQFNRYLAEATETMASQSPPALTMLDTLIIESAARKRAFQLTCEEAIPAGFLGWSDLEDRFLDGYELFIQFEN